MGGGGGWVDRGFRGEGRQPHAKTEFRYEHQQDPTETYTTGNNQFAQTELMSRVWPVNTLFSTIVSGLFCN